MKFTPWVCCFKNTPKSILIKAKFYLLDQLCKPKTSACGLFWHCLSLGSNQRQLLTLSLAAISNTWNCAILGQQCRELRSS